MTTSMYPSAPEEPAVAVEELEDGTVAVGEPEGTDAEYVNQDDEFYRNLVDELDAGFLAELGTQVKEDYDNDETSRSAWKKLYEEGFSATDSEDETDASSDEDSGSGLSTVKHPLVHRAITEFNAHALAELFPPGGPAMSTIKGKVDEQKEQQAERVQNFLNYQITEEMEDYEEDLDQLLYHLPRCGHVFRKGWFDPDLGRPSFNYILPEDLVVDYTATTLYSAQRFTHILRVNRNRMEGMVEAGFYKDPEEEPSEQDNTLSEAERAEGKTVSDNPEDTRLVLLEQRVWLKLKPTEAKTGAVDPLDEERSPYIVTVEQSSEKVIAVRRDWKKGDSKRRRRREISSWKFLPGLGFYGLGLYHVIGGLGHAATDIMRAILDSAAFSNLKSGFQLASANESGEFDLKPGFFPVIKSQVDDINKAIKVLDFPDNTASLFSLLGLVTEEGQKFASTAGVAVGEGNNNAPVGTTLALIENGSRVFSAIHLRCHRAHKQDLRTLGEINAEHLGDNYPYKIKDDEGVIAGRDFDDRVDIVPVSDPRIFSSTQRIALAQSALQLATQFPQKHDIDKVLERFYRSLRMPDYEELLIKPIEAVPLDPVSENIAIINNKPVRAYLYQNHLAHIQVLDQGFMALPPQAQQIFMAQYIAHRAEHMAYHYFAQVQSMAGAPLPPIPAELTDPKTQFAPVDPRTDAMVSQAAAVLVSRQPPNMGPPPPTPGQQPGGQMDPTQAIMMAAKAEAEATMMKTKAEIEAKQQQHQADLAMQAAEFRQQMQLEREKAELEVWKIQMKTDAEIAAKAVKVKTDREAKLADAEAEAQRKGAEQQHDQQLTLFERAQERQQSAVDHVVGVRRAEEDHQRSTARQDEQERTRFEREDELERERAAREDELARAKKDKPSETKR